MAEHNGDSSMTAKFNGKTISLGMFNGKTVFGGSAEITLSGSINDNNCTNCSATDEFSVSGSAGATGTFDVVLGADFGYEWGSASCSASDVTVSGLGSSVVKPTSWNVVNSQCVGSFSYTIPSSNETDNFSISAEADKALSTFSCSDWTGYKINVTPGGVADVISDGNANGYQNFDASCPDRSNECLGQDCTNETIQIRVPAGYSNAGTWLTCSPQLSSPAGLGNLDHQSEWTGSATISSSGKSASIVDGNLTSVTTSTLNFSPNGGCKPVERDITVYGTVNDDDYCNDNSLTSFPYTADQSGSGVSLNPSTPSPSITINGTVSGATAPSGVTDFDYYTVPSNIVGNACEECCSERNYTFHFSGTIPNTYCDGGDWIASKLVTQPAGGKLLNSQAEFFADGGSWSFGNGNTATAAGGSNFTVTSVTTKASNCTASGTTLTCTKSACDTFISGSLSGTVADTDAYCNAGETGVGIGGFSLTLKGTTGNYVATCSGVSVGKDGSINCPSNAAVCEGSKGETSFETVKTDTERTVNYTANVPSNFCNYDNGNGQSSVQCTVTQPANVTATLSVSPASLTFYSDGTSQGGNTITVTVNAGATYSVQSKPTWVSTVSINGSTATVSVNNNNSGAPRYGTITFVHGSSNTVTGQVSVIQQPFTP